MAEQDVTFRDFAGALMSGDEEAATRVLSALLGIDEASARTASQRFRRQMGEDPSFMQKAMGMRQVVEARDEPALAGLIEACFGLDAETAAHAAATVFARYR